MKRKTDTHEEREYWDFIDKTAKRVEGYPEWKRGGSSVGNNDDSEKSGYKCSGNESDTHRTLS
jgi:hypothetical protein